MSRNRLDTGLLTKNWANVGQWITMNVRFAPY